LPGTKFYEKVKSQLKEKQNWTDSNDLAMMFSGTFNPHFYKKLHSYTHKEFQIIRGVESLKRGLRKPNSLKKDDIKTMLKTPLYWFLAKKEKFQLSNMENKNERN
jgi:anaerobic magnesium-protoporphyrin IX monomethyl ester cyclase